MDILSSPFGWILWVIHIIVFIRALIQILSSSMDWVSKILWIVVVWIFPVVGLIVYLLAGRKT